MYNNAKTEASTPQVESAEFQKIVELLKSAIDRTQESRYAIDDKLQKIKRYTEPRSESPKPSE